jgi:hypothetical protein
MGVRVTFLSLGTPPKKRRPLRLVRVYELLERDEIAVGYRTLSRYVQRELGWGKKQPTVRLDDPRPGQEAQTDFGLMGSNHR